MRIVATGTFLDEYPDAESFLSAGPLTPELRDQLARAQAGELVFVRSTELVEFDADEGPERLEETPQGPHAVALGESATSALLAIVTDNANALGGLGDLGIAGMKASRFEYHAAPRRIDVDPGLAERLILD